MGNSAKPGIIILISGLLGLIVAGILQMLYDNEILIDIAVTGSDMLIALQVVLILIFLLAGAALAALSS